MLILLPTSLYFDFFEVESGQTKVDSGRSLRGESNAKRRRSSEGEKYLRRRGCKIFTASASPRAWASRNLLNTAVVWQCSELNAVRVTEGHNAHLNLHFPAGLNLLSRQVECNLI